MHNPSHIQERKAERNVTVTCDSDNQSHLKGGFDQFVRIVHCGSPKERKGDGVNNHPDPIALKYSARESNHQGEIGSRLQAAFVLLETED